MDGLNPMYSRMSLTKFLEACGIFSTSLSGNADSNKGVGLLAAKGTCETLLQTFRIPVG